MKFTTTVTLPDNFKTRVQVEAPSSKAAAIEAAKTLGVEADEILHEDRFACGDSWRLFAGRKTVARVWAREKGDRLATPEDSSEVGEGGLCNRCGGTGRFVTYIENGQPKGPGGICFRCRGKGLQTLADVHRNDHADRHQRVR